MFLNRVLFMAPRLRQQQQQRCMSSERKLTHHWRPIPVQVQARSSTTTDQKRPPLLLVKSFYNLRHMDSDYGEDISRVTDELSFPPHRNIFIKILQLPSQCPTKVDSIAEGESKGAEHSDTELPDPVPVLVPVPVTES